jgi:HTH-type transcriptional regulator/antitoxin HipB
MRPVTTAAEVATILASRRKQLKLSQAQVAARVGLSQNRLSVLEADATSLNARQLLALLDVLGLELAIDERAPANPGG